MSTRVCLESIKIFHALFGQSHWQVGDKCLFHNLTLTPPQILHRKTLPVIQVSSGKASNADVKHLKYRERNKPGLRIPVQIWLVMATDVSRSFPKPCPRQDLSCSYKSSHGEMEEQSLSWENNRREKINKVSSGAIRKRNNQVRRNSPKSRRTTRQGRAPPQSKVMCLLFGRVFAGASVQQCVRLHTVCLQKPIGRTEVSQALFLRTDKAVGPFSLSSLSGVCGAARHYSNSENYCDKSHWTSQSSPNIHHIMTGKEISIKKMTSSIFPCDDSYSHD